ncbi:phospholipase D family protein [Pseudoroseomonas deserti]|uniref:Phospholipase D n=1 Tax=Teichococcus deserti TaxID=1817963 RepID=A0A1V2GYP7_9PROT|nr:phospholipase D family protein [Pseudoroseomonas deserti]ONG49987.1 phospholipase D family protein [Pseudoroseomonas deserti]
MTGRLLAEPLPPPIPMAPIRAGAPPAPSKADEVVEMLLHDAEGAEAATSGVSLLPGGLEAFMVRAASTRAAGRTLDLQYYRWSDDVTGGLLAREVLRAADRGVRVRMLLDDSYALGVERRITLLSAHPRIEVRLFNTARLRWLGQLGLGLEFALGGWHLNHRMHNKSWVVDGRLALVGGRNIADAYFDASGGEFNFRDLDLLIAGQAARQAQDIFDNYWASSLAKPVESFAGTRGLSSEALQGFREELEEIPESGKARPYIQALARKRRVLLDPGNHLLPAEETVRIIADPPAKAKGRGVAGSLYPAIEAMLRTAQREAVLISPYFVPGRAGLRLIGQLRRRGVKVTVITNSLAATDVVAVHAGYARYRPRLLRLGVELYELKRSGAHGSGVFGSRGASLHTKAVMVDGEQVFVGSFNLDPRSANLNTEMGAFARHPGLARQLEHERKRLTDPRRSFKVSYLAPLRRLAWTDETGTIRHEPVAPLGRRIMARLVRWLPIEAQL